TSLARLVKASTSESPASLKNAPNIMSTSLLSNSNSSSSETLQPWSSMSRNRHPPESWRKGPPTSSMSIASKSLRVLRVVKCLLRGPLCTSSVATTELPERLSTVASLHHGTNSGYDSTSSTRLNISRPV